MTLESILDIATLSIGFQGCSGMLEINRTYVEFGLHIILLIDDLLCSV